MSIDAFRKKENQRTAAQNRALHLLFRWIAEELNAAGIDHKVIFEILKNYATVPWSETTIKEIIWRTLQWSHLHKQSTTQLTTTEIDDVFNILNKEILVPKGIVLDFPGIENLMLRGR